MTTSLSFAGAGWAARVHALAASVVPGVTIPVVATRSVASAEELATSVGAQPATADRLPGSADAVLIATPPGAHAELAVRLLAEGTPVLIEKPLAVTLAEADAIVAAAEGSGAAACYAENLLFAPVVDVALNRRPLLGALDHLSVRMVQPAPQWGHFLEPLTAGGVLLDLGVHAVGLAMVLAGDAPVAVRARLASSRDDGADDVARLEIRFEGDLIAALDVAWGGEEVDWSAQASSPNGVVRVELQPSVAVEVDGESQPVPAVTLPEGVDGRIHDLGYHTQLAGFCDVVARRGGRVCPVGFGRAVLDLVCAAYASARQDGEEVLLPFTGRRDLTPMQLWKNDAN